MKIIKPRRLGLLHKSYQNGDRYYLAAAVAVFFSFQLPDWLLSEAAMWKLAATELGKDGVLDMGMPKLHGEVLIKGACFAPQARPAGASQVRLRLGPIDKTLYVIGNRYWRRGTPTAPEPFTRMDISWRNAFGGSGYARNPAGEGFAPVTNSDGSVRHPLPNIEDPGRLIGSPNDRPEPVGFEPYDISWAQRFSKSGTYDQSWFRERFPGYAADMDWSIFNAAPADQQLQSFFTGSETLEVTGMHPDKSTVQSRLPRIIARCFINRAGENGETFEEIRTVPETLWIFPHLERAILLYRGVAEIGTDDAADVLQMVVGAEAISSPREIAHYREVLAARLDRGNRMKAIQSVLRESDLLPPKSADSGADQLPEERTERGPAKGIMRRNVHRRVERELAAARDRARQQRDAILKAASDQNLPPPDVSKLDQFLATKLPPYQDPPQPEDLDLEQIQARAEAANADAAARAEKAQAAIKAKCGQLGIDYDKMAAQAKAGGSGPPRFSAEQEISRLQALSQMLKSRGLPSGGIDDQLASPGLRQKLAEAERHFKETYRQFAHHFPPAAPLPPEAAAQVKARVVDDFRKGRSFANANLTSADLSGLGLGGADFRNAFLEAANFTNSNLAGANFAGAVVARANFAKANLAGSNFAASCAGSADFSEADASGGDFSGATLFGAILDKANFTGAKFEKANLLGSKPGSVNLSKASLTNIRLMDADLSGAKFSKAAMERQIFLKCKLEKANFDDAAMRRTVFLTCNLDGASFRRARTEKVMFAKDTSLKGVDFSEAAIERVHFRGADLEGAKFISSRINSADLSGANLKHADARRALARQARMVKADLTGANLDGANLFDSVMQKSILSGASIRGANLYRADVLHVTIDSRTDFTHSNLKRTLLRDWKSR